MKIKDFSDLEVTEEDDKKSQSARKSIKNKTKRYLRSRSASAPKKKKRYQTLDETDKVKDHVSQHRRIVSLTKITKNFNLKIDPLEALKRPLGTYVHSLEELSSLVNQNTEFTSDYDLQEQISSGGFGTIYLAKNKSTKETCITKVIDFELLAKDQTHLLIRELRVLNMTDHPNLVKKRDSYLNVNSIFIVLEYCSRGSLSDIIMSQGPLCEKQIVFVCHSIIKALVYLHDRGIVHRDIKASNVLVVEDGQVKLGDFGTCSVVTPTIKRYSFIGTPYFMAPEVIKNAQDKFPYDQTVDIWSLGITAIECAEIDPPHSELCPMKALHVIPISEPPNLKCPEKFSSYFVDFVNSCVKMQSYQRPTAAELNHHVVFKSDSNSLESLISLFDIKDQTQKPENEKTIEKSTQWSSWTYHANDVNGGNQTVDNGNKETMWTEWSFAGTNDIDQITSSIIKKDAKANVNNEEQKEQTQGWDDLNNESTFTQLPSNEIRKIKRKHKKERIDICKELIAETTKIRKNVSYQICKQTTDLGLNELRDVILKKKEDLEFKIKDDHNNNSGKETKDKINKLLKRKDIILEDIDCYHSKQLQMFMTSRDLEIEAWAQIWTLENEYLVNKYNQLLYTQQTEIQTVQKDFRMKEIQTRLKDFTKAFEKNPTLQGKLHEVTESISKESEKIINEIQKHHEEKKTLFG